MIDLVWYDLPRRHARAFVNLLRRRGDDVGASPGSTPYRVTVRVREPYRIAPITPAYRE